MLWQTVIFMYYLLRQTVYTDAHAYSMHVILAMVVGLDGCPCIFSMHVAVFVYVLTCIFFTRYDFKSVYFVLMHFILLPNLAILIPQPAW